MRYIAKSAVIGRKKRKSKDDELYPCFIALFDINDPHKTAEVPKEIIDYENLLGILINGLDMKYMLPGSDIILNNLEYLEVEVRKSELLITGKQVK